MGSKRTPARWAANSWWGVLRRSLGKFGTHDLSDRAAALTYYAMLSLFPGLIVLVAMLGLLGQHPSTSDALLDIVERVGPDTATETFRGPIEGVVRSKSTAGTLLGAGLLVAIWSASSYVGSFVRASSVIYEVKERRPAWTRRPLQVAVTLVIVLLLALVAIALVVSGELADAVGDELGVGETAVTVYSYVRWAFLAAAATGLFALLYFIGPNIGRSHVRPRSHWVTPGSVLAAGLWVAASLGFSYYVSNFGSHNKTYGSLGAVIVFLIWLWISNIALLLGAEYNAELERTRERGRETNALGERRRETGALGEHQDPAL